jgi:hypothetical protein
MQMKAFTPVDPAIWLNMVGQKVWKNPKTDSKFEPKPFKSGRKVNTVKAVVVHVQTGQPGFTFLEDESCVQCCRCSLAPEGRYTEDQPSGRAVWRLEREAAELLADPERGAQLGTPTSFICFGV